MGSLRFRLMGAFVAVVLVAVGTVAALANRATTNEFQLYVTRGGQAWAHRLAPTLASYYTQNRGWSGVDRLLQSAQRSGGDQCDWEMAPWMMGFPRTQGSSQATPSWGSTMSMDWEMWSAMDLRAILADAQGMVVADSAREWVGRTLSPSTLNGATPISTGGQTVGWLVAASLDARPADSSGGRFLESVNHSILLAALASGGLALLLGLLLFRQITSPLGALAVAAQKVAAGDLSHRVAADGGDEIGRVGRAFNTMADKLAFQEEQRRNLLADVAHELRNPLAVIQGEMEAMLDGVMPLDREMVAAVHEETVLLGRLVADLRLLSLAEVGQLQLDREPADLLELVRRIVERVRPQAQEKRIALELEAPSHLPTIRVDADRIGQVVHNLLSNALRYTARDGRVAIRVAAIDGRVEISVADDGPGIPTEELPHLFDRFYRSDRSRPLARDGSGLGLAIVKQLVEAHGGSVGVESNVGKGTRFWFALPTTA